MNKLSAVPGPMSAWDFFYFIQYVFEWIYWIATVPMQFFGWI